MHSKNQIKKTSSKSSLPTKKVDKVPLNQVKQNLINKVKNTSLQPRKSLGKTKIKQKANFSGIYEDVKQGIDVGLSLVDTIVSTVENPIDGLVNKLPNSIAKFADMANSISKPLVPNSNDRPVSVTGPVLQGSKDEKFLNKLKEEIPLVTVTQFPSSFSPDYSPAPLVIKDAVFGKTPCIRINGSVIIESITMSSLLFRHRSGFLNPGTTNLGTILPTMSNQYQKHIWLNTALFYIPQCPSTSTGNIILTWQNSPNNTYTPTTSMTELSQRSQYVQGHVNRGMTLPLKGDHKILYNFFGTASSDLKFYSDWSYEWWSVGGIQSELVGYIGITFDLLLFSRIESPLIGLSYVPHQVLFYLSCCSGFSLEDTRTLLERVYNKLIDLQENSLELIVVSTLTNRFRKNRVDFNLVGDHVKKIMNWEGKPLPYHNFLSALTDIFRIRQIEIQLSLKLNPNEDNFITSYIFFILMTDNPELEVESEISLKLLENLSFSEKYL